MYQVIRLSSPTLLRPKTTTRLIVWHTGMQLLGGRILQSVGEAIITPDYVAFTSSWSILVKVF